MDNQHGSCQVKYPLHRLDSALRKFIKILQVDMSRLEQHRKNIKQFIAIEDWKSLNREQINTSRTISQFKSNIKQLEQTRTQVDDSDVEAFDNRIHAIHEQSVTSVRDFLQVYGTQNISTDLLPTSNGCSPSVFDESLPELTNASATDTSPDLQLQCHLVSSSYSEINDPQALQSFTHLEEGLEELTGLIQGFAAVIHEQQEVVDDIEGHVESAQEDVHQGAMNIVKASKWKYFSFPVIGALLGGAVGGPVGFVAGVKLGGMAAIGGGILGYTGGGLWKKHRTQNADADLDTLDETSPLKPDESNTPVKE